MWNRKIGGIMLKQKVLNILFSFATLFAIVLFLKSTFYNVIIILLFFGLMYFYNKTYKKYNKKTKCYSIILSIIFSLFISIGNIVSSNLSIYNIGYLNLLNIVNIILMFFGFMPFLYRLFCVMFNNLNKINIIDKKRKEKIDIKKTILIFLIIFIGWFILFLRFYPAIMTPDSHYVINNVIKKVLSDHHTFGHTWFFGAIFTLGKLIFGGVYGGIAFYTIMQMILMDLMFTYAISFLYNKNIKKYILIILTIFISLNPLFSHYSVTLWRDVLFGMSFLTIFISLYKYITNKYNAFDIIIFTLSIIILLFFRNNGIYILIFMSPFIILIGNKKILKAIYFISIIILYFIIKGPIFDYYNVEKGLEREAYSIPIQQISRVIAARKEISEKDLDALNNLYDVERAKVSYNPVISDKMKETINSEYLKNNKKEFLTTWFNLLKKYPLIYFEAYFTQTLGYWYPDVIYWATAGESVSIFDSEIYTKPLLPDSINNLIDKTTSRKIPFSMFIWSIGLNVMLLIISMFITIYKNGKKHVIYYIPFYGLLLTMLIATPVYAELRYVFGIFVTIPFMIILSLINEKSIKLKK